ncbi:hypothetical protein N9N67_09255 [Bacteriovoracaceae bacterium]|nr:hypothetical protein [Bacteriovoracaceae bacterium]
MIIKIVLIFLCSLSLSAQMVNKPKIEWKSLSYHNKKTIVGKYPMNGWDSLYYTDDLYNNQPYQIFRIENVFRSSQFHRDLLVDLLVGKKIKSSKALDGIKRYRYGKGNNSDSKKFQRSYYRTVTARAHLLVFMYSLIDLKGNVPLFSYIGNKKGFPCRMVLNKGNSTTSDKKFESMFKLKYRKKYLHDVYKDFNSYYKYIFKCPLFINQVDHKSNFSSSQNEKISIYYQSKKENHVMFSALAKVEAKRPKNESRKTIIPKKSKNNPVGRKYYSVENQPEVKIYSRGNFLKPTKNFTFSGTVYDGETGKELENSKVFLAGRLIKRSQIANFKINLKSKDELIDLELEALSDLINYTEYKFKLNKKFIENVSRNYIHIDIHLFKNKYAKNKMIIVTSWAKYPRDIDSHLVRYGWNSRRGMTDTIWGKYDHDGYQRKESLIWYGLRSNYGHKLDVDDQHHYGPETITVPLDENGHSPYDYSFYVTHFAGKGDFRRSETVVQYFYEGVLKNILLLQNAKNIPEFVSYTHGSKKFRTWYVGNIINHKFHSKQVMNSDDWFISHEYAEGNKEK